MYYLIYKLLNKLAFKVSVFRKVAPMIYSNFHYIKRNNDNIVLELKLDARNTHLGDRLFLIHLIQYCINYNIKLKVDSSDISSNKIYRRIFGTNYDKILSKHLPSTIVLILEPSYLKFYKSIDNNNYVIVDFNDHTTSSKISFALLDSFKYLYFSDYRNSAISEIRLPCTPIDEFTYIKSLNINHKYYLFNNYIDSGKFRLLFINNKKLIDKCVELKKQGYHFIHVGSNSDKIHDLNVYNFIDIDLRGHLSIEDLILLTNSEFIVGAITYDNFIMHLIGLAKKNSFILFRGRFSKQKYDHHINYVNNTFYSESKIYYI